MQMIRKGQFIVQGCPKISFADQLTRWQAKFAQSKGAMLQQGWLRKIGQLNKWRPCFTISVAGPNTGARARPREQDGTTQAA